MPNINLTNKASVNANYGDEQTPINFTSNLVTTTIVQGLTVTKTADKSFWVDGPLLYTIEVNNESGSTISGCKITDTLDTALVTFDNDFGVKIDNVQNSNFKYESGTLTVDLPSLNDGQKSTITFQVAKNS